MVGNLGPNSQARQELEAVVRDTLTGVGTRISNIVRDAIENSRDADAQITEVIGRDISRTLKSIIKLSDDYARNFERIRVGSFKVRDIQREIDKLQGKKEVLDRLERQKRKLNEVLISCSLGVQVSYKVGVFNRDGDVNIYNTKIIKEMLEKELDSVNQKIVETAETFENI